VVVSKDHGVEAHIRCLIYGDDAHVRGLPDFEAMHPETLTHWSAQYE